jgi:hypothetical protein
MDFDRPQLGELCGSNTKGYNISAILLSENGIYEQDGLSFVRFSKDDLFIPACHDRVRCNSDGGSPGFDI